MRRGRRAGRRKRGLVAATEGCVQARGEQGPGWQDVAAWLVVVSSALIAAKDTVNWLTGVPDGFGEKAKTVPLGAKAEGSAFPSWGPQARGVAVDTWAGNW